MPWKETCPMDERAKFVMLYEDDESNMAELCRQFWVEPKTGYKWVHRYEQEGLAGLTDRSHAPHHHPNAVLPGIEDAAIRGTIAQRRTAQRCLVRGLQGVVPHGGWVTV